MAMRVMGKIRPASGLYSWYIEPLNDQTKEDLLRETPEEDIFPGKICNDGKGHNLCRVLFPRVKYYIESKIANTFLLFEVWVQINGGKIFKWPLMDSYYRKRRLLRGKVKVGLDAYPERSR